jgi:lipoyl(octanoyl) transferase
MEKEKICFEDLGLMEYKKAWDYQESLFKKIWKSNRLFIRFRMLQIQNSPATQHYLLFTEHPPVYTLGKNGNSNHVLLNQEELLAKNISYFQTNRGGDITFHGPGQLVGYPILDLEKFETDLGKYLRNLEEVIILTLAEFGISAGRSPGETGVWIEPDVPGRERKICAMGVRSSRWITMHGFALNVNTDLSYFNHIIPCGIANKQVTSIQNELKQLMNIEHVKEKIKSNFEKVFGATILSEVFC